MTDERLVATPSQTVGPFFHVALRDEPSGGIAAALNGERIRLRVAVTDADARPVEDALVEVWHAAASNDRAAAKRPIAPNAFGRKPTDANGVCEFDTVRPPEADAGDQAAHINVCLFARGLLRQLHTRIYFAGDAALAGDPVLALVPADRRETLLAHRDPADPGRWLFHLRLQGAQETVFFDP